MQILMHVKCLKDTFIESYNHSENTIILRDFSIALSQTDQPEKNQ